MFNEHTTYLVPGSQSISIKNEMYSPTSSHSPTLKLAKDLAAILLPFKCLLTYIKAGAGAWRSARLTTCLGSVGITDRTINCLVPGIALTLATPYENGWCARAFSVFMLSRVDKPGYDNYLDMLTETSFCAGSDCE